MKIGRKMVKIGRKMVKVAIFVNKNPGLVMLRAAEHVGPHGSAQFGYRTVHRAIRAGLVRAEADPKHKGRTLLYPE